LGDVSVRTVLAVTLLLGSVASAHAAKPQYRVVAQLPAGDGGWDLLSVNSADQRLYLAHGDGVTAIDLRSGKAQDHVVTGQRVHAALAIPGTHDVISTNGQTNNATLFDGRTGRVRATIPTGTKPDAATFDPATGTVWIMNPGSGDITVVDPTTAKVLDTVPVGGSLELGAADGMGRLYVNIEDKNEVAVVDTRARKVLTRFPLAGCGGPTGIAYDPGSEEVVSACGENAVAIVSARDGRQIARVPVGGGADGAVIDAKRHVALVPGGRDGNLTIIHLGAQPAVVGQVPTAVSARTIALDPRTGRAYLPSSELAPAVGNERPKALPGTFRMLVVAP
jgi:YVTN family beta-propeller protein